MLLRNLTWVLLSLSETEGGKIMNSCSSRCQEARGHNAVKEILTGVSVAILEKQEWKWIFKNLHNFFLKT